jgi:hypothetical protein
MPSDGAIAPRNLSTSSSGNSGTRAASRKGNTLYLHVLYLHDANPHYNRSVEASFAVDDMTIAGVRVHFIAPSDLRQYVTNISRTLFGRPMRRCRSDRSRNGVFRPVV